MAKYTRAEAKDYAREKMRGIYAANLTPFAPDGAMNGRAPEAAGED